MTDYIIPETYQNRKDSLWINFIAREFRKQSGYGRGGNIEIGPKLGSWKFLAPNEINETISHDWGEYESIGSRVADKIGKIGQGVKEGTQLIKGLSNVAKTTKESSEGINAREVARRTVSAATNIDVPNYKIDTPIVYQNSKRRFYEFTFNLAVTDRGKGARTEVFEPIRELQKLTCAQQEGLVNIKFPSIFKIYSSPSDIIKINFAAVTSVLPTWTGPYKDGYPMFCQVQISIEDIEPLYRKSFETGGAGYNVIRTDRNTPPNRSGFRGR